MEKKTMPAEGNARKRRNNATALQAKLTAQQREQQREWERERERAWISGTQTTARSKAAAVVKTQGKNLTTVAVVAPTGKNNNNNSHSHSHVMRRNRCARESAMPYARCSLTMPSLGEATPCCNNGNKRSRPKLKPLEEAHEQLEKMLTRIEQEGDGDMPRRQQQLQHQQYQQLQQQQQQRCKPMGPVKHVRQQMENPPPVPTGTPLNSARRIDAGQMELATTTTAVTAATLIVPLTQTPQTVLELLSRDEQQEQQQQPQQQCKPYANDDDSDNGAGDRSNDALQMLPLALTPGESPYCERFWAGQRQKMQLAQQTDDKKVAKTQSDYNDKVLLEEEHKDVLDVYDLQPAEIDSEQEARQLQAMEERAELDRQKQLVSECRVRHRLAELKHTEQQVTQRMLKKAKQLKELQSKLDARESHMQQRQLSALIDDDDLTPRPPIPSTASNHEFLVDALRQRQQFRAQCQQSPMYFNNPKCPAPWTLFANISYNLSSELMENIDTDLHQGIVNVINDLVDDEIRSAKRRN